MRHCFRPIARGALLAALVMLPIPAQADALWQACQAGDSEACLQGSAEAQAADDVERMERFIRQGCELGNVISCGDLGGRLLISGRNLARGLQLVTEGCEAGYGRACTNLGWALYSGIGVASDPARAAGYYRIGCDKGSAPGCRNLGLMYAVGDGVATDTALADRLFQRACQLGARDVC